MGSPKHFQFLGRAEHIRAPLAKLRLSSCAEDNVRDVFAPQNFFDKKRTSEEVLILRSNPVDVSWEHGAFLDIGDAEEASGDALEADGEAAVRRHAVAEGLLSETERIRIHATTEHLLAVVGCSVRPSASALSPLSAPRSVPPARRRRAYLPPRMARPHPLLRGIFSHSQLRLSRPTA